MIVLFLVFVNWCRAHPVLILLQTHATQIAVGVAA
jgi:hypothetical protein